MRLLIFFLLPGLSPFSFAHAAGLFSRHFNEPLATVPASLRGNRLVDHGESRTATNSTSTKTATNGEVVAERVLQQVVPPTVPMFVPLACNKDPCVNGAMNWTELDPRVAQKVLIRCGVCVTMDYDQNDMDGNTTNGYYLKIPKGLEIQGSLIFPDNNQYRLTIETPSVVVQGNLNMSAVSSVVTGQPRIRFILTGSEKVSFTPISTNAMGCPVTNSTGELVAGNCDIGIKPFVVAGGRMVVRGLPVTCKTWVKLTDVALPTLTPPCAADNLILNGDAELNGTDPYPNQVGASIGFATETARLAVVTIDNNTFFSIDGRGEDSDSIVQDLASFKCFTPGMHFSLKAMVQLTSITPVETIMGYRIYYRDDGSTLLKSYGVDVATCPSSNGNWVQCEAEFTFILDPSILPENIERVRLFFETVNAPTVSMLVDDWKLQVLRGPPSTLLVPAKGVRGCWGKGSEILITSHTTRMEDAQVRRLMRMPYAMSGDNDLVRLDLDDYLVLPPLTALQDDGFEVEVALLSRNIVLEGARDEADSLLGGHFMVMRTPSVAQVLEGIEYNNFGRQGELGKYPLHFHLCQSSPSLISKNLIRNSNQRCIVIHGTHNSTVFGNVAFNTSGHCFMTEDGGEIDNKFEANLGASTLAAERLVKPGETDVVLPSTFWCSNPMNEWVGNVAAGSKGLGFWFELEESVRPPTLYLPSSNGMNPRELPLKKFVNNVAHSNRLHGLRTYPNGMFPSNTAIVEDFRSYKNGRGILMRRTDNVLIKGGVLADNGIGSAFDNVKNITMDGMKVIGISNRFRDIIETQDESYAHDHIVGLDFFLTSHGPTGVTIQNVEFLGFEDTKSEDKALIQIDPGSDEPALGILSIKLQGITVPNGMDPFHFDFNDPVDKGIAGLYLIDIDSSMNPDAGSIQGTSTVIADTDDMKAFVDMSQCDLFLEYSYLYCKQTCLRTITFAIDPAETDRVLLRMTMLDANNSSRSFLYRDGYNVDGTEFDNTDISKHRVFSAALPPGSYQAEFVTPTGRAIWPSFVEAMLQPALCENALANDAVEVFQGAPSAAQCATRMIRNGNMEESSTDYPYWLHSQTGIELVPGVGLNGTNAIATLNWYSSEAYIAQYIDTRCLKPGAKYDVRAWVRLERLNGTAFSCNGGIDGNCPVIQLHMRTPEDDIGSDYQRVDLDVAVEFVQPYDDVGWNLLQGTITVTAQLAAASSVWVSIERRRAHVKMFVDNVSMTRITQSCNELVSNGDFAQGTSIFWRRSEPSSKLGILTRNGNHTLQLSNRKSATNAIGQYIETGCMAKGNVYLAQAKIQVLNPIELDAFDCNPVLNIGDNKACPRMRLKSVIDRGLDSQAVEVKTIAETEHGNITSDNGDVWLTMSGIFLASDIDEEADETILLIDGVRGQKIIVVGSVSIAPLALRCSELIRNGDAEAGPTAQFWDTATINQKTVIEVIQLGSDNNHGFYIPGRTVGADGLAQSLDPRCMRESSKWTLTAQMKLVSKETGMPTTCEEDYYPTSIACPFVRISGYLNGVLKEQNQYRMTDDTFVWIADDMNDYVVEKIQVSEVLAACDKVVISFRFHPSWELLIDNISMKPYRRKSTT